MPNPITSCVSGKDGSGTSSDQHNTEYCKVGDARGYTMKFDFAAGDWLPWKFHHRASLWYGGASVIDASIMFDVVYALTRFVRQVSAADELGQKVQRIVQNTMIVRR